MRAALKEVMTEITEKTFPILYASYEKPSSDLAKFWPWGFVKKYHHEIWRAHGQTVERLAERGGLHPKELYAVIMNVPSSKARTVTTAYANSIINQAIEDWEHAR